MSNFRLNSRNFFLTYPQCGEDKSTLLTFLKSIFKHWTYICVSREVHQDGGLHLHALICCSKKTDIRGPRLDFQGFHGNYQAARDVNATATYIKKDGDYQEEGSPPQKKRSYSELTECQTESEYWELAANGFARDFVLNHDKLEYFANKRFRTSHVPTYESPFDTPATLPVTVQQWADQRLEVLIAFVAYFANGWSYVYTI